MKTPIQTILDRADFRCVHCNAKMGTCDCASQKSIKLHCPSCDRWGSDRRLKKDGKKEVLELVCPECAEK